MINNTVRLNQGNRPGSCRLMTLFRTVAYFQYILLYHIGTYEFGSSCQQLPVMPEKMCGKYVITCLNQDQKCAASRVKLKSQHLPKLFKKLPSLVIDYKYYFHFITLPLKNWSLGAFKKTTLCQFILKKMPIYLLFPINWVHVTDTAALNEHYLETFYNTTERFPYFGCLIVAETIVLKTRGSYSVTLVHQKTKQVKGVMCCRIKAFQLVSYLVANCKFHVSSLKIW